MIVSGFLDEMRDILDDANKAKFPDATVMRIGDRQLRDMFRTLVQGNKEFSNFTMSVNATAAAEVLDNVFEYRLPTWIMHVAKVSLRSADPTTEATFSPYRWTGASNAKIGTEIPKFVDNDRRPRWTWEGNHTLRLHNYTSAQSLVLNVVVRPSPLVTFAIDRVHQSTSKLYLPAQLTLGTVDLEEGAFVNAEFKVTSTVSGSSAAIGAVRRCVYSTPNSQSQGARLHELTFDAGFGAVLAQGDTVESLIPLPDEHTYFLVLKTAQAAFIRKPNITALQSISASLLRAERDFHAYATSRDRQGPSYLKSGNNMRPLRDPDRPYYGWS